MRIRITGLVGFVVLALNGGVFAEEASIDVALRKGTEPGQSIDERLLDQEDAADSSIDAVVRAGETAIPPLELAERSEAIDDAPDLLCPEDEGFDDVRVMEGGQLTAEVSAPGEGQLPRDDLERLMMQTRVDGVDYRQAIEIAPRNTERLRGALQDARNAPHLGRVALLLSLTGDPQVERDLIDFIMMGSGSLSEEAYDAKSDAILSLGYLANTTSGQAGLRFLLETATPEGWRERRLGWRSPYFSTGEEQSVALARLSLIGLALSGTDEAGKALRGLAANKEKLFPKGALSDEEIAELIDQHRIMQKLGIVAYNESGNAD